MNGFGTSSSWLGTLTFALIGGSQLYGAYIQFVFSHVRLGDDISHLMTQSHALAKANGYGSSTPESMLLCALSETLPCAVLTNAGLTFDNACQALGYAPNAEVAAVDPTARARARARQIAIATARHNDEHSPDLPNNVRYSRVYVRAMRIAFHSGVRCVNTEHLLLAILKDRRGAASKLLRAHGVTPQLLRAETKRQLGDGTRSW